MEYLLRPFHVVAGAGRWRPATPAVAVASLTPRSPYRRFLLATAIAGFVAHVLVVGLVPAKAGGAFLSNLLQLFLGAVAFFAMLDAAGRSQRAARWVWVYAAAAIGTYTAGQLIFIAYDLLGLGQGYSPRVSDQFFFFWVVPLLAASAIDMLGQQQGFDSTVLLDFAQLLILGVILHVLIFGDNSRWQNDTQHMEFLKLKVRVIRDLLVLGWFAGRIWLGRSRQLRALFSRLALFYLVYSLADAVYLYSEARWDLDPGTWFDLLWSLPRLLAVVLALTWTWQDHTETARPATHPRLAFFLRLAPVIAPLAMLAISFHAFVSAPVLWASLMVGSFGVASIRLLIMQSRQGQTTAELHNSNRLLNSIIEGTTEAIYLKDPEGRYTLINTAGARYMGYLREEVLGKTDRELLSPETVAPIRNIDREVLAKGKSVSCEEQLIGAGGTRTFLSTKNPYHNPEGRVVGVLGISVDITERRRMEEQLRRVQRVESIGAFSGAIAHDFRNELTVIKGYSEMTIDQLAGQPAARSNLEQVVRATDRAAALIQQLLAFGRQQVLQPRVINLNDIVSHLHKMLSRLIGDDIEIVSQLAPGLWFVKADPGQMAQVLMNLAANARDAMPRGGKLLLETANIHLDRARALPHADVAAGDYAVLSVSDTGNGMDAHTQDRIFEPFFTTKPEGKGTGLGLATAYGIVKQSDGHISVESQPGSGTSFRIYLPRAEQPLEYRLAASESSEP